HYGSLICVTSSSLGTDTDRECRLLPLGHVRRHLRRYSFFVRVCRARRALHSFPTRRSSDLVQYNVKAPAEYLFRSRDVSQTVGRSEEHTSELQSRVDLVCRLLLEKKKTRTRGSD